MKLKKISIQQVLDNSDVIQNDDYEGYLIAGYLFDETALRIALQENDNQSLAVGMIYLDNSATTKPCPEAVAAMTQALTDGSAARC